MLALHAPRNLIIYSDIPLPHFPGRKGPLNEFVTCIRFEQYVTRFNLLCEVALEQLSS